MKNSTVRVRYAPSPTGMLHIGGARSALYNYLFARHYGGQFIIRIEDTDIARNVEGGEDSQIDGLLWLGIDSDESTRHPNPKYVHYRQSERLSRYKEIADEMIKHHHAYYCFCSPEEIEADREKQLAQGIAAPQYRGGCHKLSKEEVAKKIAAGITPCIRIRLQDNYVISFNDLVRGEVSFNNDDIGDWVLMKSNGIPTYNFAVVVDDHDMEITHVFRGEEHLSNTPKQIQIFKYLNWDIPQYGHMTLITNEEGKKLSKRDPNIIQFIQQYRDMGYLPEAIFNFILLLGWSPNQEREIFSREEAIAIYDPARLSKSPSMFDRQKLDWLGKEYVKALPAEKLYALVTPFLVNAFNLKAEDMEKAHKIIDLFKDNLSCGNDIVALAKNFFSYDISDKESFAEVLKESTAVKVITAFRNKIANRDLAFAKDIIKEIQKEENVKGPLLYMPIRVALTTELHGPDLASIINILGREEILRRIDTFVREL